MSKGKKVKKGVLICFVGMDGSGKSTLSRGLYEELKKRGYSVSYTWWLEGENSLLRRLLRRVWRSGYPNLKNNKGSTKEGKKTVFSKIFHTLWPRIVLLDYLRFGIIKVWFPKIMHNKVVIFDRYIYDVILGLSREFNFEDGKKEKMLKIFSKLLPNPDLMFIIDVLPEVAYSRKKDEIKSLENARQIWGEYQRFYPSLNKITSGKILKIDNAGNITDAKIKVLKIAMEVLRRYENGK